MRIEFPSREFDDAVAAVCHDLASEDQARALNELLRLDPAARDEYILRLEVHSRIASQADLFLPAMTLADEAVAGGRLPFAVDEVRRDASPAQNDTRRNLVLAGAVAACLALLAVAGWRLQQQPVPQTSDVKATLTASDSGSHNDWKPSSGNLPGEEFPRINSETRAQFRITAPNAKHVSVNIGHPLAVSKNDGGVWTLTTAPLGIGFHFYQVIIDGKSGPDPATPVFRGGGGAGFSSGIEVPTGEDFHERKNVPHGEVRELRYFSRTTEEERRVFVYTPPSYREDAATRFPVLYLLPGAGEDESVWSAQGRTAEILDNLIAEKRARPMLVVMEGGIARRPGALENSRALDWNRRYLVLEEVFTNDLIPFVDGTHRTRAANEHRAIAGLSLGGAQAVAIGLRHPEHFAHIGAFSGVGGSPGRSFDPQTAYDGVLADAEAFNRKTRLLFASVGADEPDWIMKSQARYHESLQAMGINHVFYVSPDTRHEWHTWRRSLREFVPLLFRE